MRLRTTTRSLVMITVLSGTAFSPAAAQAQPFGSRGSLIFTEISPYSPASPPGVVAWLEIHNATSQAVPLDGLEVERADGTHYEVPTGTAAIELQPGGFLVVRFDAVGQPSAATTNGNIVAHAPRSLAADWLPPRGELALLRRLPSHPGDLTLVDHVAWGTGAAERAPVNKPPRWRRGSFVELAENFGVYDPDTTLPPGSSIGLYPGSTTSTPSDWVIFDPDEVTPGHPNRVPRPKGFTLADGAEIGSQSFAVGWAHRRRDEWYAFEVAADQGFRRIVFRGTSIAPVSRLAGVGLVGRHYYRVTAHAAGIQSEPSYARSAVLFETACDWPFPPSPLSSDSFSDWIVNPSCGPSQSCKVISSIRFKFQRKDTPLACELCDRALNSQSASQPEVCRAHAPHPFCQEVKFVDGGPSAILCAGGLLSPLCGNWPVSAAPYLHQEQFRTYPEAASSSLPFGAPNVLAPLACDHGNKNCVKASISMIASAYSGACLSQDYISYRHYCLLRATASPILEQMDIGHGQSVDSGPGQTGADCTKLLAWALTGTTTVPASMTVLGMPASFADIRKWIDDERPVMSRDAAGHMRVLSGYCVDNRPLSDIRPTPPLSPLREWVLIYDPATGPRAETYTSWSDSATLTWIAPSVTTWPAHLVSQDPPLIWTSPLASGVTDFDEVLRFVDPKLCPWPP